MIVRDKNRNILCEHSRIRYHCKECGGAGICEHDRYRTSCRQCVGCDHNRIRSQCKECGGSQICAHDRIRNRCKECGGFLAMSRLLCSAAKARARIHKIPFDITSEDILKLIGDGVCPVFGFPFVLNCKTKGGEKFSATLDRFFPDKGYILGNCSVISKLANSIKSNATAEQIKKVLVWMEKT